MKVSVMTRVLRIAILLTGLLAAKGVLANTCTTCYIDYENGNDSWTGTSKTNTGGTTGPWKHAPGMLGLSPSGTSTGDGCTGNCAAQVPKAGDKYVLKGGVVWPYTTLPWRWTWSGSSTTSGAYGCAGSGCVYVGVDPTWNKGIVNAVTLNRDIGGCSSAPSVNFSGGGGNGAAATAAIMPTLNSTEQSQVGGFVTSITLTNQGNGYTSNPLVSITGGGCTNVQAVADTLRAIIDCGKTSGIDWPNKMGNAPLIDGPGLLVSGSYVIVDNLEYRNLLQQTASSSYRTGIITTTGAHDTVSNTWIHGRYSDCVTIACQNSADTSDTAIQLLDPTGEAAYNYLSNSEAMFVGDGVNTYCGSGKPCMFSEHGILAGNGGAGTGGANIHNNHIYGTRWMIHAGSTATLPFLVHDNEMWLVLYDIGGAHVNELYFLINAGTLYEYNNIFHTAVSGASNQQEMGNGTTQYFFNNISWGLGGGTPNYGIDASFGAGPGGGHFYFFNNTMYGNGGTRNCIDAGSGPNNSALFVVLQNNYCITAASPYFNNMATGSTWTNQAGSSTVATVNASSLVQSASTASSQGYVITSLFAPKSSSAATLTFATSPNSANLTSLCNGYLVPLCSDIYGVPRPTSGGWQAGAFDPPGNLVEVAPAAGLMATVE